MADKPHVSPSQLDSYARCGEAYRRRYIEKHIIPPSFAMHKGSGIHIAAEVDFKQKMETRQNMKAADFVDLAAASFEGKVSTEGVLLDDDEESQGPAKVRGLAKDSTVRMAGEFANSVAPKYQPVGVEEKVRIELPGPRDIVMVLDLRLENGVQDTKTSGKAKSQADIDKDVQFTSYAAAYEKLTGKPPERIIIDNVVDYVTPAKQVAVTKHLEFTTTRDRADIEPLARRINTVVKGIEAGMFTPATPGAWWCSASSCGYWKTCPYVNGERKAAGENA